MQVPLAGWCPSVSRVDSPLSDPDDHVPEIRLGSWDPAARKNEILVDGRRAALTAKEFALLECLAQQRGFPRVRTKLCNTSITTAPNRDLGYCRFSRPGCAESLPPLAPMVFSNIEGGKATSCSMRLTTRETRLANFRCTRLRRETGLPQGRQLRRAARTSGDVAHLF